MPPIRKAEADAAESWPPFLALAGPTAAGKSAAAMAVANEIPVEIISVDSALVYRGMDIGTAKPSATERLLVPHHLIDIRDPLQAYSAAEFAHDARALMAAIHARGRLPLLVGGTMLYFKALFEGLAPMPPADAALRAGLLAEAERQGWPALHARLASLDPVTAARLAPGDSQRIQRALEVIALTGQPMSALHQSQRTPDQALQAGRLVSLEPADRSVLHRRIAERFAAMLSDGLLAEVQALRARGDLSAELPAMRCVGYRQCWQALDEGWSMDMLRERGIFATRQLAKRQLTWLRGLPQRHVVHGDAVDAIDQVLRHAHAMKAPH